MWNEEVPEPLDYRPVLRTRYGADPVHVKEAAGLLINGKRAVIYAGQGVHYAQAWPQLKRLAERLAIPVTTSLGGKSSFPETHPLSLGSGGLAVPRAVPKFLAEADVIFGMGCSFTETIFGIAMPKGKTIVHATLDPAHLNKDVEAKIGLVGDAGLVLDALLAEIETSVPADRDASQVAAEIAAVINVWGDAAIGFTGMVFETAVRERIPILSILLNNFSMAIELKVMPVSTEKYRSTDISGDYAAMARAFGGYGERVTEPAEIIPAIQRGFLLLREGILVLLVFFF